jgi:nucleoside 2-deoxyribosyltransferase
MKDVYEMMMSGSNPDEDDEEEDTVLKVYLCSKIKKAAQHINDEVAEGLRRAGFEVFVPHEAPHNLNNADDYTVFKQDYFELSKADLIVVVPGIGVDCAWELGWASASGLPIYAYTDRDVTLCDHPMVKPNIKKVFTSADAVYRSLKKDTVLKDKVKTVEDPEHFGEVLLKLCKKEEG